MTFLITLVACLSYDPADGPTDPQTAIPTPAPTQVAVPVDGGSFELVGGVQVAVPPETLTEPLDLTVTDLGPVPDGYTGFSNHFAFGPEGAVFDPPLEVRIPFTNGDAPRMFWSNGYGGYFQPADQRFEDDAIVATIHHFSTGFIAMNTDVEEVVVNAPPAQLDVLFVIDNSCSMSEEQSALSADFSSFLLELDDRAIDYHIGVTTTDPQVEQGLLRRTASGQRFVTPSTPDALATFSSLIRPGVEGWYEEMGRDAAHKLLTDNLTLPRNVDFYRDDADLHIVFVSDEPDFSVDISAQGFVDFLAGLKTNGHQSVAHAITGLPGQLCSAILDPGTGYIFVAEQTGGSLHDLCEPDLSVALAELGLDAAGRKRSYSILRPADPTSITVNTEVPGTGVETPWTEYVYTAPITITFTDDAPMPGDLVKFRYLPL